MKRALVLALIVLLSAMALAKSPKSAKPQPQPAAPQAKPAAGDLESVLSKMDATAASFKTLEASFVWDRYMKIVDEHTLQKGTIYFRRVGQGIEMAANIPEPANERTYVLFTGSTIRVYQPNIEQVTEYNVGKNRETFESMLLLGFGGRGHDLQKSYDVKFAGNEQIEGVQTAKLELVPKSQKMRSMFSQIILWIDPARGISVQQQFIEPQSGDYRLAKYSNIRINKPISDDVFKLKTTSKTKTVRPQG